MSTYLDGYYVNAHRDQFDGTLIGRSGCTWTSDANGLDATTGGKVNHTPAYVHSLVKRSEETNPTTPGWSIPDARLAASRLGVSMTDHSGEGWTEVVRLHQMGHYLLIQGDSDQFNGKTCSGDFDGDHCIGVHPASKTVSGVLYWWIDDPICPTGRWERASVIRAYAEKLNPRVQFGAFNETVPHIPDTSTGYHVTIAPRSTVRIYKLSGRPGIDCIASWTDREWGPRASSAPCDKKVARSTCDGKSAATTVKVTKGTFAGRHIRVGRGVTYQED